MVFECRFEELMTSASEAMAMVDTSLFGSCQKRDLFVVTHSVSACLSLWWLVHILSALNH